MSGAAGFDPSQILAALGGKGGGSGGGGPMDPAEKRKLMKEIKDEMKPLINQLCDFQIEKANMVIKNNLRKLETDLSVHVHKLSKKIDREVKTAKQQASDQTADLLARLEDEVGLLYKNIARNKTDTDLLFNKGQDTQAFQKSELEKHEKFFQTMATILSSLVENVNMQMEAETADLLDRRMMQLYGVAFEKPDKNDLLNIDKHLSNAKEGKQSPFGKNLASKLMNGAIPELGLTSPRKLSKLNKNTKIGSGIDAADCIDSDDENERIEKKVSDTYQKRTTLAQNDLRNEYNVAFEHLKTNGKLPYTIDPQCLSHQSSGRDVGLTMKMFKTACMTYQSSNVAYREHTISRTSLVGMRRDLIDKIQLVLEASPMFQVGSAYPRRYFDDLVVDQAMGVRQAENEAILNHSKQDTISQLRLTEMLQTTRAPPFQQISGKQPNLKSVSKFFANPASPRYKPDEQYQPLAQQMVATSGSIFSPSNQTYNIMQNQMLSNPIHANQTMQLLQQNQTHQFTANMQESAEKLQNLSINLETETGASCLSQPMSRKQMKAQNMMRTVRNKTMNKSPSAMLDTTIGLTSPTTAKKPKNKIYLYGQQSQAKLPQMDPHQMSAITLQPMTTGAHSGLGHGSITARKRKNKKNNEGMFGANAVSFTTSPTSMRDQNSKQSKNSPPLNLQIPNILTQLNERNSDSQNTRRDVPLTSSNNYSLPQI